MKISIDLDGILVNFMSAIRKVVNIPDDAIQTDWWFTEYLKKEDWTRISEKNIRTVFNFWETLSEYPENVSILREFWKNNPRLDIYFITARDQTAGDSTLVQTCQWLKVRDLWPRYGNSSVIVVRKPENKWSVINALDIKFSLDDKPETVEECTWSWHKAYLLNRPWNKNWKGSPIAAVSSMSEYLEIVKKAMELPELEKYEEKGNETYRLGRVY